SAAKVACLIACILAVFAPTARKVRRGDTRGGTVAMRMMRGAKAKNRRSEGECEPRGCEVVA
ncbi:hypothetical protein ACI3PL_29510, partial [Lacticaseibacillus paracasei]